MIWYHPIRRSQRGFTLVELIVVIAILAILAGVAIPVYSGYIKKANLAADEQLLAAVNTAYAAACVENLESNRDRNDAVLQLKANKTVYTNVSANPGINASFEKYFAGNTDKAFKELTKFRYVAEDGVFVAATAPELQTLSVINPLTGENAEVTYDRDAVLAYKNSNLFNVGINMRQTITKTLSTVDNLVNALTGTDQSINSLKDDDKFMNYLIEQGITDSKENASATDVARGLVTYASDRLAEIDPTAFANILTGNFTTDLNSMYRLVSGGGSVTFADKAVSATALFALTMGYAGTEAGKADSNAQAVFNGEVGDYASLTAYMMPLYSSESFQAYLKSDDVRADTAGLLGVLGMVAGNDDLVLDFVKAKDGFNSSNTQQLIAQIINAASN